MLHIVTRTMATPLLTRRESRAMSRSVNPNSSQLSCEVRILEDDPQVLDYLRRVVEGWNYPCRPFSDPVLFLTTDPQSSPACVIIDWQLPGHDGLVVLEKARQQWPQTAAILVSGHVTVPVTVEAMRRGAVSVLAKPIRPDELKRELTLALKWSQTKGALAQAQADARQKLATLSPLELSVLKLLVEGTPNKNIATQTGLAIRTVEKYRRSVFDKLGVDSAAEATRVWVLATLEEPTAH
jgi:FixJ family two-component response regulator